MSVHILRAALADLPDIAPLRSALWPDSDSDELIDRANDWTGDAPDYLLLIARSGDQTAGFAEASLRTDYVNGCDTSPVAFVEGLYVDPAFRRTGTGRALVEAIRLWGRERGVTELASDALADNLASHAFHHSVGFAETERVIYFRMTTGTQA